MLKELGLPAAIPDSFPIFLIQRGDESEGCPGE